MFEARCAPKAAETRVQVFEGTALWKRERQEHHPKNSHCIVGHISKVLHAPMIHNQPHAKRVVLLSSVVHCSVKTNL